MGEMVAIRAQDLDLSKSYLHVRAANARLKKARTVVLLPPVLGVLKRYLNGRSEGWLFPSRAGDHLTSRQVQRVLLIKPFQTLMNMLLHLMALA